jgi:hypothetical protein
MTDGVRPCRWMGASPIEAPPGKCWGGLDRLSSGLGSATSTDGVATFCEAKPSLYFGLRYQQRLLGPMQAEPAVTSLLESARSSKAAGRSR